MNNQPLRESLEQLHRELEQTQSLDADSRERLRHLMKEIQSVLDESGDVPAHRYESLAKRLRETVDHFEDAHPRLTLTIGQVLDNLAAIGL